MRLRHRHRRWIALIALLGLLFQHAAMAAYRCPLDVERRIATTGAMPPCHEGQAAQVDRTRCHAHCHPAASTVDQSPQATVAPAAILVTATIAFVDLTAAASATQLSEPALHAGAPPIRTRFCSLLI